MSKIVLSEQERNLGKFSVANLVQYYDIAMILCNNITSMNIDCISYPKCIDNDDIEEIIDNYGDDIINDLDLYTDVYQWYIIRESDVNLLENDYPIYYCDELDLYIVGITHLGVSWDMVYTNVEVPQFMLKE